MNTHSRMAARLSFDLDCDRDNIDPSRDSRLGGALYTSLLDSSDPEAVLRNLFDQINMGDGGSDTSNGSYGLMRGGLGIKIVKESSPNLISVEFSDVLTSFILRLCGQDTDVDSRKSIEELLCKILNERLVNLKPKSDVNDARKPARTTRWGFSFLGYYFEGARRVTPVHAEAVEGSCCSSPEFDWIRRRTGIANVVLHDAHLQENFVHDHPAKYERGRISICGISNHIFQPA